MSDKKGIMHYLPSEFKAALGIMALGFSINCFSCQTRPDTPEYVSELSNPTVMRYYSLQSELSGKKYSLDDLALLEPKDLPMLRAQRDSINSEFLRAQPEAILAMQRVNDENKAREEKYSRDKSREISLFYISYASIVVSVMLAYLGLRKTKSAMGAGK